MESNNNENPVEVNEKQDKQKWNSKKEIISWVKVILSALIIAFVLRTFVFQLALVNQISMDPTLKDGQMLIISKVNYFIGDPQRGDIIVFKDSYENKLLIKRVIGLPGEKLDLREDKVFINDKELQPDYTSSLTYALTQESWQIPEGQYFVMGDNREHSRDSRVETVGLVNRKSIVGKAVFRLWPFNKLGVLK